MPETICTLLATLGGQPQVVTFTLDLLLQRHIPIHEVIVVHPASYQRLRHSINCLNTEFLSDRYKRDGRTIHFRSHILRNYESPIDDITDDPTADGTLNTMDELIRSLKQQQHTIHFSITGGRRLMSFLSFSAALLNFTPTDHLWHLYTPDPVQQRAKHGAIMHVTPEDGVRLIEIPFARMSQPILSRVFNASLTAASTQIRQQNVAQNSEKQQHCKEVWDQASPAQRKVLRLLAQGLHPQQVANHLVLSLATVNSHTHKLLGLCRNAWEIDENHRFDYRSLQMLFADYFNNNG